MGNMGGFLLEIWEIWENFFKYGRKYEKYGRNWVPCVHHSQRKNTSRIISHENLRISEEFLQAQNPDF